MLVMETIKKIRIRRRNGDSIRKISREMQISRNTVKKFIYATEVLDQKYKRQEVKYPQIGPYQNRIDYLFENESDQFGTKRDFYDQIRSEGYSGSYSALCRYLRKKEDEFNGGSNLRNAYIPLKFDSGEAYQFDWSTEWVEIGGELKKVKAAHFVLCHSRYKFTYIYPCETQEMVFDAHIRAFRFFGGVPRRGIYDNMKTAVNKILKGKDREWNSQFDRLCAHYRIEAVACNPAAGWEKGQVEKQVEVDRNQFFTPRRKAENLNQLNEELISQLIIYNRNKKHPIHKTRTLEDVYLTQEKESLAPISVDFSGARVRDLKISSTCLATFECNEYSVDCHYAGQTAQCHAYADRLEFVHNEKVIGVHQRHFTVGGTYYDWKHYLPVLLRKPGALRNGAPFKDDGLPEELQSVYLQLKNKPDGTKAFIRILASIQETSLETVLRACRKATQSGAISDDVILNDVYKSDHKSGHYNTFLYVVPSHLKLKHLPTCDCSRYNQLLTGSYA